MSHDPCGAFQQRVDELEAALGAARASMPKPPAPPSELQRHEYEIWELNRELIAAVAALERCRNSSPAITLSVNGSTLVDITGATVLLRGINYPILDDWNFPGSDNLDAIIATGANAIRIVWYKDYDAYTQATRPAYSVSDLDGLLARCQAAGVIPIVELGDLTGQSDPQQLNTQLIPWWTAADVVTVLNKYESCLIINLANELGYYHFSDDEAAAQTAFIAAYTEALQSIRTAGLAMPVMIDAPDYGTSLDFFAVAGAQLVAADPDNNVLLSTHAYWAGTDYTPQIATCLDQGLPLVFGEVANFQDDDTSANPPTYYYLGAGMPPAAPAGFSYEPAPSGFNYTALLPTLIDNGIGWLAWSWGPDECPDRQLSNNGVLTSYGDDIVDNPTYGTASAVKATTVP